MTTILIRTHGENYLLKSKKQQFHRKKAMPLDQI